MVRTHPQSKAACKHFPWNLYKTICQIVFQEFMVNAVILHSTFIRFSVVHIQAVETKNRLFAFNEVGGWKGIRTDSASTNVV